MQSLSDYATKYLECELYVLARKRRSGGRNSGFGPCPPVFRADVAHREAPAYIRQPMTSAAGFSLPPQPQWE